MSAGRTKGSETASDILSLAEQLALLLGDGQVDTGHSVAALPARHSLLLGRGLESVTSAVDPGRRQRCVRKVVLAFTVGQYFFVMMTADGTFNAKPCNSVFTSHTGS